MEYYVIRGGLSDEIVDELFGYMNNNITKCDMLALNGGLVYPALFRRHSDLYTKIINSGLLQKIEMATNTDELRLSKHSDFHINTLGWWHDDTGKNVGGYLPPGVVDSKIFKVGIFEKPHDRRSPATQFKINGVVEQPELKRGDVLVFPVEIMHRGYPGSFWIRAVRTLKSNIKINALIKLFEAIESALRLSENRKVLFFTVGKRGAILDFFEKKNMSREDVQISR